MSAPAQARARAPQRFWTNHEINLVRGERTRSTSIDEIALTLNRTSGSVRSLCRRHKLSAPSNDRAWSEAEVESLRTQWRASLRFPDIPGRTNDAIANKAAKLSLGPRGGKPPHTKWTPERCAELRWVAAQSPELPRADLARAFGTTQKAIWAQASRMGLTLPPVPRGGARPRRTKPNTAET